MSENKKVEEVDIDYLDVDDPIRNQNFVCISFLNPGDVIVNKEAFYFSRFLNKFSNDMKELFDNMEAKFPDNKETIKVVRDNYDYIFKPSAMSEQYAFFKNTTSEVIEKDYHAENNFRTSIMGIKIRGVYDRKEEAEKRVQQIRKKDKYFNIYVADVGCWLPYETHILSNVQEQEYDDQPLNTLMKHYKQNKDEKDALFDERKMNAMSLNQSKEVVSEEPDTSPWDSSNIPTDTMNK